VAGSSAGGRAGSGGTTATGGAAGKGGSGGSAASAGSTGSGGTTASSTSTYSTAPTQCSFPSNWTVGSATYTTYTMPNAISGCGYNVSNNNVKNIVTPANFAAIPGTSSSDFNTSNRCGACIQIGNAIATIVDECPYDGNNNPPCKANPTGHMDLSNAAAGAGNVKGDPNVRGQNQWKYVPCPVNGNVIVRLKSGNSNEIFIENEILPIAAVTCNGQTASRTSYGAWHFSANVPGATCEVTDIAGRKIGITVGSSQGQDVDTKVQFPKCL
jgi:expansin